ncbi:MAG: hypothetical protein R6X12_07810 [bacterium]
MNLVLLSALVLVPAAWTSTGLDLLRSERAPRLENVLVDHDGAIRLSAGRELLAELDADAVWRLAAAPGGAWYVGTGSDGRLYTVGRAAPVFDSVGEGDLLAVAPDARAGVLFGLTPGGTVHRLAPGRAPEQVLATGEDYVFDLLAAPGGEFYAATGAAGRLYRFSPGGQSRREAAPSARREGEFRQDSGTDSRRVAPGELVFTAPQAHITCLAWLEPGRVLLAGTSPDGIVYRLDIPPGRARPEVSVLYDTPYDEVRALAVAGAGEDAIVFVAANGSAGGTAGPPPPRPGGGPARAPAGGPEPGAVLCVRPNGVRDWQWSAPESAVYDLAVRDGEVLVATGREGLIYRLDRLGRAALFAQLPAARVLCLVPDGAGLVAGTSEPAAVFRLPAGLAASGSVESEVRDCAGPATFGRIEHRATVPSGASLALDTRTGNSERPDSTWSEWLPADGTVRSRPARFIQWRARLGSSFPGRTPTLERVTIHYRVPNRPPRVTELAVSEPSPAEAARGAANPVREITWTAADPDEDSLAFTLSCRPDGLDRWLVLAEDLGQPRHELDTRLLPDGWYRFRVEATDAPARPASEAARSEVVSPPALVDNTPPRVTGLRLDGPPAAARAGDRLLFTVTDAASPLAAARVAVNAGPWQPALPLDGLFDREEERFAVPVSLRPGANHVAVWAADARGNAASAAVTVTR